MQQTARSSRRLEPIIEPLSGPVDPGQAGRFNDGAGLALTSIAPGVKALHGEVATHRERKVLHREVADALDSHARDEVALMNELSVASDRRFSPKRLLGVLKRDHYLAGVPFSLPDPKYKGSLHVEIFFDKAGSVTISGRVPDATFRAYLEARLWTSPGVKRVINRTSSVSMLSDPDLGAVMTHMLETNPKVPREVPDQIEVHVDSDKVALEGHLERADFRQCIERDAWAIPHVCEVENLIEVPAH